MSLALYLLDKMLRLQMKRRFERDPDMMQLRPMMAEMERLGVRVPARVRVDETAIGGVPCERLAVAGADLGAGVLYVHGGGFVACSPKTYRSITWRLADQLKVPVYVPDYRLAPEHPFPAGLDDVVAVARALVERGVQASRLAIAGDSAGGNLTFGCALRLKALRAPMPAALVALSPVVDIPGSFPSRKSRADDDAAFDPRTLDTVIPHYCPNTDPGDPLISPFRADLTGLPPTLVQCSDAEMLRDDGVEMVERLKDAVVAATLELYPKAPHVWQLGADYVPEARRAIAGIVAFIAPKIAARGSSMD